MLIHGGLSCFVEKNVIFLPEIIVKFYLNSLILPWNILLVSISASYVFLASLIAICSSSLIYLLEHNAKGAMGLVLNKSLDLSIDDILEQVDTHYHEQYHQQKVLCGGPVESGRGFVLHKTLGKKRWNGELVLNDGLSVTASTDILTALMKQQTIEPYLLVLGFSAWQAGQLEQEIKQNHWWARAINPQFIFTIETQQRLAYVLKSMGISYEQLSQSTGRA